MSLSSPRITPEDLKPRIIALEADVDELSAELEATQRALEDMTEALSRLLAFLRTPREAGEARTLLEIQGLLSGITDPPAGESQG